MKLWSIAANDLRIFLRDIPGLIYLILTPVIVIAIASFALSGMFTEGKVEQFPIPIVVEDEGGITDDLVSMLKDTSAIKLVETYTNDNGKEESMTREQAKRMIFDHKAAIIIPKGF